MPKDGLRPLPDRIIEPFLRALATILGPRTSFSGPRVSQAPARLWRSVRLLRDLAGQPMGREGHRPGWRFDYSDGQRPGMVLALGMARRGRPDASGHALTLESAVADMPPGMGW